MNEATMAAGSQKIRQHHLPRPRSGSWGNQELAYYKSFERPSPSYPSKFLSMSGPGSKRSPSKRPPLPLEMVQPEHLTSTPVQGGIPSTKKRSTRIRSISQFFKSLSSKPLTTTQPHKSSSSVDIRHEEGIPLPVPPPKNQHQKQNQERPGVRVGDDQQQQQQHEQAGPLSNVDELISKLPAFNVNKRLPKCPTFHGSPLAPRPVGNHQSRPPLLHRKSSGDDSIQPRRRRKKSIVTSSQPFDSDISDEDANVDDNVLLDISHAQESQIAGDCLSKRLSGGHFGSAGGLIISTTPNTSPAVGVGGNPEAEATSCDSLTMITASSAPDPPSPAVTEDHQQFDQSQCQQENEENEVAETAKRIWEDDPTVYHNLEHIAEWMGDGKPLSTSILKHYLGYFDFTNRKLDAAFRTFCSKLHLKAETQQIDRVLGEFAHRYWDCNPFSIFGNLDVVHAIVYSLLLLNTDLHAAQGDHRKMSQNAFVRNTLSAIQAHLNDHGYETVITPDVQRNRASTFLSSTRLDEDENKSPSWGSHSLGSKGWMFEIEVLLRDMYTSIRHRQIADPLSSKAGESGSSTFNNRRRSLQITAGRVGALKRSVGTIMWKSTSTVSRESMVITEMAEPVDSAIAPNFASSFHRRRSMSSMKSSASQSSHLAQTRPTAPPVPLPPLSTVVQRQEQNSSEVLSPIASAAPYYKEGTIARKHLLERAGQKARHRDWKECFLVVDCGEIRMYKTENDNRKSMALSRNSIMLGRNYGTADGLAASTDYLVMTSDDWLSHAELAGTIDLKHTLANSLPSGYSRHRPHAFAVQQPNGGVYLFQVGSAEEAVEWVTTCNYWAARESKEPLMGGVSNVEYGWGNDLNDDDGTLPAAGIVHEWHPPIPPTVQSALDEQAQLASLHRHVQALNEALDQHRDLKRRTEARFRSKASQAARAMSNWENKSQYLLHEIIKYQNYCDAIERSLALQVKASCDDEDREE